MGTVSPMPRPLELMVPEAFESGGRLVGLFTTLGFATAVAVDAFA